MYTPYFKISPKITEYLTQIGIIYGYLKSTPLPTKYQKEYQNRILSEIIHSSTAIEGNSLSEKQVHGVLNGVKIKGYERDVEEVENYYKAIKYISGLPINSNFKFSEEIILKINGIILNGIRDEEAGKYRTKELYVGTYIPPKPKDVPTLTAEFIDWLSNPIPQDLSPILYAGIAHYKLVAIHPFIDGNGRTTRILTKLMLKKYGYDFIKYFSLESYYNRQRKFYYEALDSADSHRVEGQPDLSIWLEYFTLALFVQAQRAQTQIETLIKTKPRQIKFHLNERQKKIILYLKEHSSITTSEYMKISSLSPKGAYNDLQKLNKAGIIEKKGVLKSSFYILKNYKF
jgi:Fic family protein